MTLTIPGKVLQAAEARANAGRVAIRAGIDGEVAVELEGLTVAMCGGNDLHEGNPIWDEIVKLSAFIAERGGVMVNGGGPGAMLASAQAFPEKTLGVLVPSMTGNAYGAKAVVEDRLTRAGIITKIPVVVVFEGGVGTIEEWGRALKEVKNSLADDIPAPKLFLHNFWKKTFDAMWTSRAIPKRIMDNVHFFVMADEVISHLLS